jgi:L-ribulose-5-phosphate 3-epimerase
MSNLNPLEVGMMFWVERDTLPEIIDMGVRCGQLGVAGDVALTPEYAARWKADLTDSSFTIVTCFAAYNGEDYADIPTVERTVGFIPPATRTERLQRTLELSDFAAALGVPSIACHVGFVPEDKTNPDYIAVLDMVRRVCDYAASHGQTFALETGQEPAHVLLEFFKDVDRPNLKINFDPANLILYGSGDPHEAIRLLAPYVVSVHAKDGDWPPKDNKNALGTERKLGEGSVNIPQFIKTLREVGYTGQLFIEREALDPVERIQDMRSETPYLKALI